MNRDEELTTYDVDRILAIKQMVHFMVIKQSAISMDNHQEIQRSTQELDRLVSSYGVNALIEAESELL